MKIFSPIALIASAFFGFASGALAEDLNGSWYSYDQQRGSKQRYVISDSSLETADYFLDSEQDSGWENARTMEIVARDGHTIYYLDEDGYYNALRFFPAESDAYRYQLMEIGYLEDLDALKEEAAFELTPSDSFFTLPIFDGVEAANLEARKTFAQISKPQLVTLLEQREKHAELLEEFLTENPAMGSSPSSLFRMTHNLFLKDAIEQGLNPYAIIDGDPFASFASDPEVMRLMESAF